MAWQAFFHSVEKFDPKQGERIWYVLYTDGSEKTVRQYSTPTLTDAVIKSTAIREVARLEAIDAAAETKLSTQLGAEIDLTPVPPPDPPPDPDPARTQFLTDLRRYRSEQLALSLGLPVEKPMDFSVIGAQWDERFIPFLGVF